MTEPVADVRKRSARVLVVDDDPAVVDVLKRILERAGWEVSAVSHGAAALAAVADEEASDLVAVLLDLSLQGESGADVLLAMRQEHPDLPILLSSGLPETYVRDQHGELPYTDFVPKPFRTAELTAALERAVGGADAGAAGV